MPLRDLAVHLASEMAGLPEFGTRCKLRADNALRHFALLAAWLFCRDGFQRRNFGLPVDVYKGCALQRFARFCWQVR